MRTSRARIGPCAVLTRKAPASGWTASAGVGGGRGGPARGAGRGEGLARPPATEAAEERLRTDFEPREHLPTVARAGARADGLFLEDDDGGPGTGEAGRGRGAREAGPR